MKNILRTIIIIVAMVIGHWSLVTGQTISPKVTPTSGGYATGGGNSLSWTMGETFTATLTGGSNKLSQGEQQPEIDLLTGTVSLAACAGSAVSVPFTATGYVDAANVFTAQLSDAAGSFASPTNIGTVTSVLSGTINATIPPATPAGAGYRIRAVSGNPVYTGKDNGTAISINIAPTPSISGVPSFCAGSSTTLDANVFAGYIWSTGATTQTISPNTAGTFIVTVSDGNSCTGTASLAVTVNPTPSVTFSSANITCNGASNGTATAMAFGGTPAYSYVWNNGSTNASISSLTPGAYAVTVTDAIGCTQTSQVMVTEPGLLAVTGVPQNVACRGTASGSINVSALQGTAPYAFLWNNGSTLQNRSGLSIGTYTVTVTDANGCTKTASYSISQPASALIINTNKVNVRCAGGLTGSITAAASGSLAPYSYSWNTIPAQTTATIVALAAGVYTCNVTDAGGCIKIVTVTITQPAPLVVVPSQTNVSAPGFSDGTASVAVSGGTPGYTYSWNTVPVKTTASVTGLTAGIYKCTVSDSKTCKVKLTFIITEPASKTTGVINKEGDIRVSPNPTHGKFIVSLNQASKSNYAYVIEDVSGKLILKHNGSVEAGEHEINIDLTGMAKGIYFIKWIDDTMSAVKRIVLQ